MNRLIGLFKPSTTTLISSGSVNGFNSSYSLVRLTSGLYNKVHLYSTDSKDSTTKVTPPPSSNTGGNKNKQNKPKQQPSQQQDIASNIQPRQQRPQIVQRPASNKQTTGGFNQSFASKKQSVAGTSAAASSNESRQPRLENIEENEEIDEENDEEFEDDEFEDIDEKLFDDDIKYNITEGYEAQRNAERDVKINKRQPSEKVMPYHYSSRELEGMLRSHLRKFLAKVHPDVFHLEPSKSQINQRSLTSLNNLLRARDAYVRVAEGKSEDTKLDKIPTTVMLAFHHETAEGFGYLEHELIFEEPAANITTSKSALVTYVTELRFSVHRQLYELFRKADIPIPQIELDHLIRPTVEVDKLNDDPWEDFFDAPKEGESEFALTRILDDFLVQNNVSETRQFSELSLEQSNLLQLFNEDKVFFYFNEQAKGDLNVMRSLGHREEAERQIMHLKSQLQALEFNEWHQLPILIASPQYHEKLLNSTAGQGFVVLQKDFDPFHVLPYIKQKVPRVVKNFKDLYSISKNNLQMLEKSTIQLEKTLGANSVIIENLFSVNQRSMRSVRDQFNRSQTTISKLNIPMIKILESVRANRWISLPETRFESSVIDGWKLSNVKMDEAEKKSLAQNIVKEKYPELSRSEQKEKVNQILSSTQSPTTSDTREKPLTIVDPNQFNYIQTAPFVGTAMESVNRLTSMIDNETSVRLLFPKKIDSDVQDQKTQKEPLFFDNSEKTIDMLIDRPNIAPLDLDLNSYSRASLVTDFNVPAFGAASQQQVGANDSNVSAVDKIVKNKVSASGIDSNTTTDASDVAKNSHFQAASVKQKLSDFGWANINLILSDHYQFIMSKDDDVAYVFIPINFREEELLLFLNSHYDKIALIQKEFYTPVMDQTQKVVEIQAIESLLKQTIEKSNIADIKIDCDAIPSMVHQYESASFFKNIIFLSTDLKSIKAIGPRVNIVIGADSYEIKFTNAEKSMATVFLPHEDRTTFNFTRIITDLISKSEFFNQLVPDYQSGSFNFSQLQQNNTSTTKEE